MRPLQRCKKEFYQSYVMFCFAARHGEVGVWFGFWGINTCRLDIYSICLAIQENRYRKDLSSSLPCVFCLKTNYLHYHMMHQELSVSFLRCAARTHAHTAAMGARDTGT